MIKSLYPQFQRWAEKGAIWIIADPHLNDKDCKLIDPGWPSPEEYISALKIDIGKNDTLICLGDVGEQGYFKSLKCYKVLITGNHDKGATTYEDTFNEVYNGPLFIADRILLSHEPIYGLEDICLNIHGHVHNAFDDDPGHLNLAAEVCDYYPFNLGVAIKNGLLSEYKNYHKLILEKKKNL